MQDLFIEHHIGGRYGAETPGKGCGMQLLHALCKLTKENSNFSFRLHVDLSIQISAQPKKISIQMCLLGKWLACL